MVPISAPPKRDSLLSRREFLYLLWAAAFIVLAIGVTAVSFWYFRPHSRPVLVANIADLASANPLFREADPGLVVYVVQFEEQVRAWDAVSPLSGCGVIWVPINRRFEDPCSGAKWCLDGEIADRRFKKATSLRDYEIDVRSDGQILLYPLKRTSGEPLSPGLWVYDPMAVNNALVNCRLP